MANEDQRVAGLELAVRRRWRTSRAVSNSCNSNLARWRWDVAAAQDISSRGACFPVTRWQLLVDAKPVHLVRIEVGKLIRRCPPAERTGTGEAVRCEAVVDRGEVDPDFTSRRVTRPT